MSFDQKPATTKSKAQPNEGLNRNSVFWQVPQTFASSAYREERPFVYYFDFLKYDFDRPNEDDLLSDF